MDIKEESESIFGVTIRPSLFDADDAEYQQLRQQIIDAPKESYHPGCLPFDGVCLTSYAEFKRRETIEEAKKQGLHLFYIKEYDGTKLIRYGVGYFRVEDSCFVVLKDSFFKTSNYFAELTNSISDPGMKAAFLNSFRFEDGVLYQYVQRYYHSASLAASCFLGRKASFREWKDENGKSLDAFYPLFRSVNIDEREDKTFPNYTAPVIQSPKPAIETVSNVISQVVDPVLQSKKHVFYLKLYGICDASGTYDPTTQKFIIRAGSVLALDMSTTYRYSAAGITRRNFLNKFCAKEGRGYRLRRDKICDSPSAAAALVMGGSANGWEVWKDVKGYSLDSVYRR